jgi:aminoglycoside phosphotransferase (APT) family kinase protein
MTLAAPADSVAADSAATEADRREAGGSAEEEAGDLIPMRPDERIDAPRVGAFLAGKVPGAAGVPEIVQFAGGKANLTYLLRYPGAEYVLRRPPLGPVAPRSHDMAREYRVLSVLYRAFPLAPRAYLYCEEPAIVGAPFLVMERRRGVVIRNEMPARYLDRRGLNRRISEMAVGVLAQFHAVEPEAVGLETLGRAEGFAARQVAGWYQRWQASQTEPMAQVDELIAWLGRRLPLPQSAALVHNDFKLDNLMVDAADPARPVAVLDWDMCTLGDPMMDLGTLLGYWTQAGDPEIRKIFTTMPTHLPGFLTRREVAELYATRSGRHLRDLPFYEVFGIFKIAVIIQQIYVRWVRGQTQDARFSDFGERVRGLIDAAWACARA